MNLDGGSRLYRSLWLTGRVTDGRTDERGRVYFVVRA